MLRIILLLLFAISWDLIKAGGLKLPSYIPRCSLSDAKSCECLKKTANEVIPVVVKGDVFYNLPPLLPVYYAVAPFYATDLTFDLYNARTDDYKKAIVTDIFLDLKNREFGFEAIVDKLEAIADNYTITEGRMLDIRACGHGRSNFTFVNNTITYNARLRFYKKGDDVYLDFFDSRVDMSCDRAYHYFENLESAEECDVNAYLDENWEEFYVQMKPAHDNYNNAFVNFILESLANAVPFNNMFLP